ncbi:hypothetical protein L2E82_24511 [Cichorium intybus]|uniref:Uncharacterized protein n=1 Tax=Cichorium intybus TaxID=13427 RepID=A0ACB9E1P9_CICIN|nr:hypothetical protein L2E82_24511 [Cichorium intybus]
MVIVACGAIYNGGRAGCGCYCRRKQPSPRRKSKTAITGSRHHSRGQGEVVATVADDSPCQKLPSPETAMTGGRACYYSLSSLICET